MMKSSDQDIAEYRMEKCRELDTIKVAIMCPICTQVTVAEMLSYHAKEAKFIQCTHCGKWVRRGGS